MSVPLAYLGVILIWSTTPLAIQWSVASASFSFALFVRMLIGAAVALLIILLFKIPLPMHARARRAYLVGGLGMFGGMTLTYWAAHHVHSGLISVIFGLSPLLASLYGRIFLGERSLTLSRVVGLLMGIGGLAMIFLEPQGLATQNLQAGLSALLLAVVIYSGSLVWLKEIGDDSPPLATTLGTLTVALPLFAVVWWMTDTAPIHWPNVRSSLAIAYLGVFGSVIGFALYYYVIRHMEAPKVALITLLTPVLALALGHVLNGEEIGWRIMLGTAAIMVGLLIYQWSAIRLLFEQTQRVRS